MDPDLYEAVASGDENTFQKFLGTQKLLEVTPQKNTVLHVAAEFEQTKIVQKILEVINNNASTVQPPNDNNNIIIGNGSNSSTSPLPLEDYPAPLVLPKERGLEDKVHEEIIQQTHTSCDYVVNISEIISQNHKKISNSTSAVLVELLYKENSDGDTALHVAVRAGCLEILRMLVGAGHIGGQKVKVKDVKNCKNKDTLLHVAVRNGDIKAVKYLLEEEAELISQVNKAGESPVFLAVDGKQDSILHYLLDLITRVDKLKLDVGGRDGMNAFHAAVIRFAQGDKYWMLEHLKEMMRISEGGYSSALLKQDNILKWTPLHYAAYFNCEEVVDLLLTYRNVSELAYKSDKYGMSALHIAATNGYIGIMEKLIKKCSIICELLNKHDQTALHVAVASGHLNAVKYLLDKTVLGSDISRNKQDKNGNTPLHLAAISDLDLQILVTLLDNKKLDGQKKVDRNAKEDRTDVCSEVGEKVNGKQVDGNASKKKMNGNIVNNEGWTVFDIVSKRVDSLTSLKDLQLSQQSSAIKSILRDRNAEIRSLKGIVAEMEAKIQIYDSKSLGKEKSQPKDTNNKENGKNEDEGKNSIPALEHKKGVAATGCNSKDTTRNSLLVILKAKFQSFWKGKSFPLMLITTSFIHFFSPTMAKRASENDMLISTIIATVAFAAAFQVPGGYESEGPYQGFPVFRDKIRFQLFFIWDSMAFGFSSCSIFLHFLAAKGGDDSTYSDKLLHRAMASTFYSIVAMVAAFIMAIQLVSTTINYPALASASFVCAAAFLFFLIYDTIIFCLLWLCQQFMHLLLNLGVSNTELVQLFYYISKIFILVFYFIVLLWSICTFAQILNSLLFLR